MGIQTVSHYNIIHTVSDGVGGKVCQAEDTILRRKVALKFLPKQLTGDPDASRRFLREARSTSKIDHPNICNIHEIGETVEGDLFIAMTWYNGSTLKQYLSKGRPSVIQSLEFARQIVRGLERAHDSDVIHRDIKPSNIIITEHNELKIVDFGLARLLTRARITNQGTVMGTASYMSPEQARGEDACQASDLWSVGVVLYEMLAGELPFSGDHEVAVLYSVLNTEAPPLSMGICPEGCQCRHILKRCLEKDLSKRYETAEELLHDLELALAVAKEHKRKNSFMNLAKEFFGGSNRYLKTAMITITLILMTQAFPQGRTGLQNIFPFLTDVSSQGVAVLPFTFSDADEDEQAIANGLSWFITQMISRVEGNSEKFWLVPPGVTQKSGINTGQDALSLLGIGQTIGGTGTIQGDRISLRITINNIWQGKQITHVIDESLSNLKTWQVDIPKMLALDLDPDLAFSSNQLLSQNMTNVPLAFRDYLIGQGYSYNSERDSNFTYAIKYLNSSVHQDSSFASSLAALGYATWKATGLHDSTRLANAESYLESASILDPAHPMVWVQLGQVQNKQGNIDQARESYEQALLLDDINESALRGLWNLEMNAGNSEAAFGYLATALNARPDYFNTIDNYGVHQYYQGNFLEAEKSFRQLVQLAPQQNRGFNLLGATLFELDRYPASEIMFENSLAIGPTYTAYSNLATLYFYSGRMLDSIGMSRKALSMDDSRYPAWRTMGEAFYWTPGLRDSSRAAFQQCVSLVNEELKNSPIKMTSYNQMLRGDLASFHVRLGEFDRAKVLLEELEQESNLGIPVMFNLASSYEEMQERDKALHWLELAVGADLSLEQVNQYPGLRNLRTHPRFLALRNKYGEN